MSAPFISFYVPHFRLANGLVARPVGLTRCVESVAAQRTPRPDFVQCEQVEDALPGGAGVGGMFAQIPANAARMRGDYVMLLADDDELAATDVVERLFVLVAHAGWPDVVIVGTEKGHHGRLPYDAQGPPVAGRIDLNCVVTRRDVWLQHVHDYGDRYEGDFHMVSAMWAAGRQFHWTAESIALVVSRGAVSGGRPELAPVTPSPTSTWPTAGGAR